MPEIKKYYCVKCGIEVREADIRCINCRNMLASDGAVKIKKVNVSEKEYKRLMKDGRNLNNIGGWLSFFIFTLIIINPIFNLFLTFIEPIDIFVITEGIAIASLFLLTGIFLSKKKPYAVKFAKVSLTITLLLNIIYFFVYNDFSYIAQGLFYFIIWISYLYKSKRVKLVYGKLKEKTSGYQIWSILAIIYALFTPFYAMVFAIISLINISKNRKLKGMWLSIIGLIISLIWIVFILIVSVMYQEYQEVPQIIEDRCNNYCVNLERVVYYSLEYDWLKGRFNCYCTNEGGGKIGSISFEYDMDNAQPPSQVTEGNNLLNLNQNISII